MFSGMKHSGLLRSIVRWLQPDAVHYSLVEQVGEMPGIAGQIPAVRTTRPLGSTICNDALRRDTR